MRRLVCSFLMTFLGTSVVGGVGILAQWLAYNGPQWLCRVNSDGTVITGQLGMEVQIAITLVCGVVSLATVFSIININVSE